MRSIQEILQGPPPADLGLPSINPPEEIKKTDCKICGGYGWMHPIVNGHPDWANYTRCSCMRSIDEQTRQIKYRKFCKLPEDAEYMSFEKFRTSNGNVTYQTLKEAKEIAMQIAEGQGGIKWLVLMSDVDRGKSYLSKCICKRWLERGQSARYTSVPDLLNELRDGFKKTGEQGYYSTFKFFCSVSLLVLDDLGMEYHRNGDDWAMEQLENIVNDRYENERYMVVTTNKALDELSPRIASRLQRYTKSHIIVLDDSPEYRLWSK